VAVICLGSVDPGGHRRFAYRRLTIKRLEALKGDRKGQHSIRINDQWRICFTWDRADAYSVEIVDYD